MYTYICTHEAAVMGISGLCLLSPMTTLHLRSQALNVGQLSSTQQFNFQLLFLLRVVNSNHIDKDNRHTPSHHLHLRSVMPNWSHFTGSNWSSHGIIWLQKRFTVVEQWLWLDITRDIPYTGQGVCFPHCTCPHVIIKMLIWQISKTWADPSFSSFDMKKGCSFPKTKERESKCCVNPLWTVPLCFIQCHSAQRYSSDRPWINQWLRSGRPKLFWITHALQLQLKSVSYLV